MLSILINAYACSPGMGSEPGMAWNWCVNLAQYCELHIITEGEFRDRIEAVLPTLPQGANMFFYYNPVSDDIRRMCWNQGDWRFYRYYRKWQMNTYYLAKQICGNAKIDILHQLNMIGFREPGYLWKLSIEEKIPFVWGPIGGLKQFPTQYLKGAGIKMNFFNKLKNIINVLQIKYGRRIDNALRSADLIISSIPDSYNMIKKISELKKPVVTALGHSTDYTLTDFMADRIFSTPTSIAEYLNSFFRKEESRNEEMKKLEQKLFEQSKKMRTLMIQMNDQEKELEKYKTEENHLNKIIRILNTESSIKNNSISPSIKKFIYIVIVLNIVSIIINIVNVFSKIGLINK